MNVLSRRLVAGIIGAASCFTVANAVLVIATGGAALTGAIALAFLLAGIVLGAIGTHEGRMPLPQAVAVAGCAAVLPLLGSVGLDPVRGSYSSGAWYVAGVVCLVLLLLWRGRARIGWAAFTVLELHTWLWAGLRGLNAFGVVAALLLLAVLGAGSWAMRRTAEDVARYSAAEREALDWGAAQEAYQSVRQQRLAETARVGAPMLQRIVDAGGRLDDADRAEARLLEQTVRDEIRGRRLLNDAVRAQVMRLRRGGAVVQVNDDGGLDDIDPADAAPLLDRLAEALSGLASDRVIIRTAPKQSDVALSVVAMSTDPIAAALGLDDEDEQVDLWLELERPLAARAANT